MKVNCQHFQTAKKIYELDPKTNERTGYYWWWAVCDILGNEEEVGFSCGKKCCSLYKPEKKKEDKNAGR